MTTGDKIRFLIIRSIGNFLVLFAVFGIFATFGPALYFEAAFRTAQIRGVHFEVGEVQASPNGKGVSLDKPKTQNSLGFTNVLTGVRQQILIPSDPLFSIVIPKIGANAKVLANIDPSDENLFLEALKVGVAHAKGTYFPGQKGNIYMFAHSTDNFWNVGRYNAVFYLLKELEKGDEVAVFFQNVRHNYIVRNAEIIDPTDVFYLTHANSGQELLILQTCWPPGTTWKRLMIFAEPKNN